MTEPIKNRRDFLGSAATLLLVGTTVTMTSCRVEPKDYPSKEEEDPSLDQEEDTSRKDDSDKPEDDDDDTPPGDEEIPTDSQRRPTQALN